MEEEESEREHDLAKNAKTEARVYQHLTYVSQ
jgi:hypothetical protein